MFVVLYVKCMENGTVTQGENPIDIFHLTELV